MSQLVGDQPPNLRAQRSHAFLPKSDLVTSRECAGITPIAEGISAHTHHFLTVTGAPSPPVR
jgi:hypothetical protein